MRRMYVLILCVLLLSPYAANAVSPVAKDKEDPGQEDQLFGSLYALARDPAPAQTDRWLVILDDKLKDLTANAAEIGNSFNMLSAMHTTRTQRLDSTLLADRAVYARLTEYLLDNIHQIDEAGEEPPAEFMQKVPSSMHAAIRNAWREPNQRNREFGRARNEALRRIRARMNERIEKTEPNLLLDYSVFGIEAFTAATFHNYLSLGENYSAEDFNRFRKTVTWLLSASTVTDTVFLCYLYVQCNVQYTFNRKYLGTTHLIREGKGDCTEVAGLYSHILTLKGQNMPEVYISFEDVSRVGHAFGAIHAGGYYYFYDQSKVIRHHDFTQGLMLFFPQTTLPRNPVKIQLSRRDRRDPFNVYRQAYPSQTPFIELKKAGLLAPR